MFSDFFCVSVFTKMVTCAHKFNKVNLKSKFEEGDRLNREYLDLGCFQEENRFHVSVNSP